ncbi:MAG: hypothetical protein IAE93_06800 [Ignavibacteria bacterium]|nr:hypothetical protein [Ignavibacteria bacterium]
MNTIYTILVVLVSISVVNSQELKKIPIPTLFNTGVDNNKMTIADGETDPHYVLSISADPLFSGPDTKVVYSDGFPIGPWLYNDEVSKWIAPRADAGEWNSPGIYVYSLSFSLHGFKHETAEIRGFWVSDNNGADIMINGKSTGFFTVYDAFRYGFSPFEIKEGFVNGINTISFVVNNGEAPTGLRVIIEGKAVPIEFTVK